MRRQKPPPLWEPNRWEAVAILCVFVLSWVHHDLNPAPPVSGVEPQLAFWWALAMMVVSYVINAALAPKPEVPKPEVAKVPRIEDGRRLVLISGTVWIDDPAQLAMLQIQPPIPIKSKGGKK